MRYSMVLAWLWVALLCAPGMAVTAPATGASVPAPAGGREVNRSHKDFATYPLITARIAQIGGIKGNISATRTVEGVLSRRTYRLPSERKPGPAAKKYANRLADAGFETLFTCHADACGPTFVRSSPGYRAHPNVFDSLPKRQYYLAARKGGDNGDLYVAVQTTGTATGVAMQVDTLQVKPREVGTIRVNAAQMANDLANKGRVALYGIFFATDSARIEPQSQSTLREIAKLMATKPNLRLLVVGHTDSRGAFDYNIDLSRRRARAVVAALVDDYGVARDRLKPWGVGYAAPRASNNSEIGMAKNRRVELVPW